MLHTASFVPSSDRSWITATLCITACQTQTSRGCRECRMLLHELFAKLHDTNVTLSSFLRISIGYRCVTESTSRLPSSVIKPSNYNNLLILLVYSRHTVTCSEVNYVRPTFNTVFIDKHGCSSVLMCAPTVWNSLPSFVHTADSFTSFRSQLKTYMFARHL